MKRIKIFALSLCVMIAGMVTVGFVNSNHHINLAHAAPALAFVPLAFVKQLKEKGTYDKLDAETKAFIDTLDETLNKALVELTVGLMTKETFEAKLKEEKDKLTGQIEKIKGLPEGMTPEQLTKAVADLTETIKGFDEFQKAYNKKGSAGPQEQKTLEQAIFDACEEKKDEIANILKAGGNQTGPLFLNLKGFSLNKSAVTVMDSNTILAAGSVSHWSLTSNTGIISKIRSRILTYLSNVMVGKLSVDKPYAMWIDELDDQGLPIFIAEGDAKTQLSVRYEEREMRSRKIAVYGKVTTEFLRYLSKLVSYVQGRLMKRMDIKTEDQLFNGDGTGNNLHGIIGYATQFDGGKGVANEQGLVGMVHNPTYADVFEALALQVHNSYGSPTAVWVSNSIISAMRTDKSKTSGVYMMPPFLSPDGKEISGMTLIGTNALAGLGIDFIGGDTSVINVEFLENAVLQIGLDGNDFTNNKKTILMEQELVQFVTANDTQVLIKGTMNAAKALLSSGS